MQHSESTLQPHSFYLERAQAYWQNDRAPSRVLEIGFGHGERLLSFAYLFPQIQFYGIEYQAARFQKNQRWFFKNVQNSNLYFGQAEKILPIMPEAFFDEIWIMHPDPWPKKRAHKNRLIQVSFFSQLIRLLSPSAKGVFIQTDHFEYSQWISDCWQEFKVLNPLQAELFHVQSGVVSANTQNQAYSNFHYLYKNLGQDVYRFKMLRTRPEEQKLLADFAIPEEVFHELPTEHRNPIYYLSRHEKAL